MRGSWAGVLSWRSLVLAGVLGLAFTLVWPSVRVYSEQQSDLAALEAERDEAKAEVEDLNAELARWDDPAFVVAQARERLSYVFPGETPYRVIDPEQAQPVVEDSLDAQRQGTQVEDEGPWFTRMWDEIEQVGAGEEPALEADASSQPSQPPATPGSTAPAVDLGG